MKNKIHIKSIILGMAGIATLLIIWQVVSIIIVNKNALPAPSLVINAFFKSFGKPIGTMTIMGHVWMSLQRVIIGYGVATAIGIFLGLLMAWSKKVKAVIKPLFELIRPIPPLAWIPMAIIWFGIGDMRVQKVWILF